MLEVTESGVLDLVFVSVIEVGVGRAATDSEEHSQRHGSGCSKCSTHGICTNEAAVQSQHEGDPDKRTPEPAQF